MARFMTQKEAKAECARIGFTFRKTDWGDYRVCPKGGEEAQAYYTDDIADACYSRACLGAERLTVALGRAVFVREMTP